MYPVGRRLVHKHVIVKRSFLRHVSIFPERVSCARTSVSFTVLHINVFTAPFFVSVSSESGVFLS